jgi:L-fucose isomerase-like protein
MTNRTPMMILGRNENTQDLDRSHELETRLLGKINFDRYGPDNEETDILDAVKKIASADPAALLIDVLQGGTARGIVLAALKSKVPAVIWCHDERHSLASSSVAAGALDQLGKPYILVHGGCAKAAKEIETAVKAANAVKKLRNSRIGRLGQPHFNLINSSADPLKITSRFGAWTVPLSISELKLQTGAVSDEKINTDLIYLKNNFCTEADETVMRKAAAFRSALKETAAVNRLDAVAVDCWNEIMPGFGINPCLEFVFNEFIIACEGDMALAVMMLAGEEISGGAGYCGDLYSVSEDNGTAVLMHCSGSCRLHKGRDRLKITAKKPPDTVKTGGAVVASRPELAEEMGTLILLHGAELEKLHLRKCRIMRTDMGDQMKVIIRIEGDIKTFVKESAGNHYVVFPGDCTEEWKLWAQWSKVEVH